MKLKKLLKVISSSPNSETLVEVFNEYRQLMFCNSVEELQELQKKAGWPIMEYRVTKFFPIESQYLPENDHFGSGLIILVEADGGNHD